jgi:hypothetical protein
VRRAEALGEGLPRGNVKRFGRRRRRRRLLYALQMDHIASNVITAPIEKNMIFTIFFYSQKLTFVLCFSSNPVSLGFFSTKLHMSSSSKNWYM